MPTGTVTFYDSAAALGTGTVDASGVATLTTSALVGGSHAITATYGGDANHAGGSSAALTQIVNVAATTTALASSVDPSVFGEPVTFTALVTSAATGTTTGTVTFVDGATVLGTSAVNGGAATFTTSSLSVATHPISAVYSGDSSYGASTSTALSQDVGKASTATALASSSSPSLVNTSVTFTATVTATAPGAGIPSGTVTFKEGSTTLGTGTLDDAGVATFATSTLALGAHTITAEYGGDGSFVASTSSALTQNVSPEAATIALSSAPSPSTFGASVTFTAAVTGAAATPTGAITFKEGTATLGSGTLDADGTATFAIATLGAGTHTITAEYGGDAVYAAGTGAVSHVVEKSATTTTLVSSKNPSLAGEDVTFTATVASPVSGFGGQVEFFDGTTSLGKATLSGGTATLSISKLAQGGHPITAEYEGNPNFAASTSAALTQTVNAAPAADAGPAVGDGADAGAGNATADYSTSGGGCGCRAASTSETGGRALLALAGVALFATRRRRR